MPLHVISYRCSKICLFILFASIQPETPTAAFRGRVDVSVTPLFPPPLSGSDVKNCHILSQNFRYDTFVANVAKNLTYAL